MSIFSAFGFNRFILTLGYGGEQLRRYFLNYEAMTRNYTLRLGNHDDSSRFQYHTDVNHPSWDVVLVDTGQNTEKASRIFRVREHLDGDRFLVAYGDDVSDVDINALVEFHHQHRKMATITAVQIMLEYGVVEADEDGLVSGFVERPKLPYWINGGFMLFEQAVLDLMADGEDVNLETEVLPQLARDQQLMIYRHKGFWQSMNTMKDNMLLEDLWSKGAPWKVW
jgi:glucose-1-phosphate cytidylyltransferase